MASEDLQALLEMGFDKGKAEMALQHSRNLQQAIDWLADGQDDLPTAVIHHAAEAKAIEEEYPALQAGEEAKSLTCNDCGRKLRSISQAEFHASKSGHENFSESTETIAPLTEVEKKAKLEELRQKLAEKRAGTSEQDKREQKRNEEIRKKSTKETQDLREDLAKKEQLKEAAAKRREKQDEAAAKQRIKEKIAVDKEERRLKSVREKAAREGHAAVDAPISPLVPTPATEKKTAASYTETRLRLQLPDRVIIKTFPIATSLFEVAAMINNETEGLQVKSFTQGYPKRTFDDIDFGATLKELSLVPSASLIVR